MNHRISDFNYYVRLFVIMFAAFSPILFILTCGYLPSISSYWRTEVQPIFILTNVTTAYYLYSINGWKYSALCLVVLTAFSVELYPMIHNVTAVLFFIINLIPMSKSNSFKWCIYPYLVSLLILPFSMTFSEILAIGIVCLYHLLLLRKLRSIVSVKIKD